MTINKKIRGLRDPIPQGYFLGRTSPGSGDTQLIPIAGFAAKSYVANTTVSNQLPSGDIFVGNSGGVAVPVAMSGDATLSNAGVLTLASTITAAGPIGDSTHVAAVTFDAKGRLTAVTSVAIAFPSGGGGGAASIKDDGTNLYIAMSDSSGQLVLDSLGNPIFGIEVLPPSALPAPTASTLGGIESIAAVTHNFLTSISTSGVPTLAQPSTADLSDATSGVMTPIDASGAGLTFTGSGTWVRLGKIVLCFFNVTYPSTIDTSTAVIGGLPFTVGTTTFGNAVMSSGAAGIAGPTSGTTTLEIFTGAGFTAFTNANLSGKQIFIGLLFGV